MKQAIASFVSGLVFAIGLGISGMTLPEKVIGFLDFLGKWDPALMFVMVGAIAVYGIGLRLITKREGPLFAPKFMIPTRTELDFRLIGGAALFGLGWGIGGFCPGPALVSFLTFSGPVFIFIGSMAVGMLLFKGVDSLLTKS